MKTMPIKITGINDMTNFVKEAAAVLGDVACREGKYVVDGKSLLGVMSIDLSTGVIVEYPNDAIDFEKFLNTLDN